MTRDAILDLAQHLDQRLFEDAAAEDSLEEGVVELQLFGLSIADVQALHDQLDARVGVGNELLGDEQVGDDLNLDICLFVVLVSGERAAAGEPCSQASPQLRGAVDPQAEATLADAGEQQAARRWRASLG